MGPSMEEVLALIAQIAPRLVETIKENGIKRSSELQVYLLARILVTVEENGKQMTDAIDALNGSQKHMLEILEILQKR